MKLIDNTTGKYYSINEPIWKSPDGQLLSLAFEAQFNLEAISKRAPNLWRYREAIPIFNDNNIVSFQEGFTPLLWIDFEGKKVGIKQEQLFSTGSYKDRGATVLMSKIKELGIQKIIQDSSGNAGCAIAAYAAAANIHCTIYLQKDTSPAKIAQMQAYGASIEYINGTREDVAKAAFIVAQQTYYASHSWNPFFFEGTKTFAYEVCEQLGWKAPDSIVLPAGNGTLIMGCYIGFMDLLKVGIITKMPKLIAIQSEWCAPLAKAFKQGETDAEIVKTGITLAEGIAIAQPIRGSQILDNVRQSKGNFITVTESEIKAAWKICAQKGFYIEPTSAATIAGLLKYMEGYPHENIVSLFSGHGLKSTDKIVKMV
jgi:threonine synthase